MIATKQGNLLFISCRVFLCSSPVATDPDFSISSLLLKMASVCVVVALQGIFFAITANKVSASSFSISGFRRLGLDYT